MQSYKRWVLFAVSSVLACAWGKTTALAYCKTTTSEQQVSSCSPTCVTDGYPLAWPKSNITYVFNEKGFPGLDDAKLRGIFANAFGGWEQVDCEGEPVGLDISAASGTTTLTVGPEDQEPNASVIAHLSAPEWAKLGLDPRAFALTAIWFDAKTGRILGADMHFNGGMAPFGVCPEGGCQTGEQLTDLPNVATHEAGHFLGLAHSQDQDSTMWCDAQGNETNKRSLAADDAEGICAVYPPGLAFTAAFFPTPPGSSDGDSNGVCSVLSTAAHSSPLSASPWLLAALGLMLRRRRR